MAKQSFTEKLLLKQQELTLKLNDVGHNYEKNAKDPVKARNDLMKIYHGYHIAGIVLAYLALIVGGGLAVIFHQYAWMILMFMALVIPRTLNWSMSKVLNISPMEYQLWRKEQKQ